MDSDNIHSVYFLGIGGIGMSALARYFKAKGKHVSGYDKTPTALTDELTAEGIDVHFEDNIDIINPKFRNSKSELLVVYTPAVPKEHKEYCYFMENGFTIKKRSEVLGLITRQHFTVAIAGTHGKTTTSSIVAHILKHSGMDCTAFLGGITQNYHTNLLLSDKSNIMVVEADEYDRSFLTLFPDIAIITSADPDHLDIYGDKKHLEESFNLFAKQVKPNGKLIVKKGLALEDEIINKNLSYSVVSQADFYASNIRVEKGSFVFDLVSKIENIEAITIDVPGRHNVENAVAAAAAAQLLGIKAKEIKNALSSFKGVKRRFEYQIKSKNLVYIDDYAHHPEELKACINAVREMYPGKKITGIFQPHLYTRTRDFADGFAGSLDLLDECILLDIYPARELPIEGVSSKMLLEKMHIQNKMLLQKNELVKDIKDRELEVLLTLGAGDIDQFVEPIKKALLKK